MLRKVISSKGYLEVEMEAGNHEFKFRGSNKEVLERILEITVLDDRLSKYNAWFEPGQAANRERGHIEIVGFSSAFLIATLAYVTGLSSPAPTFILAFLGILITQVISHSKADQINRDERTDAIKSIYNSLKFFQSQNAKVIVPSSLTSTFKK